MEDQKILWIVFSVVLFAVVVLASVLYFLKPAATEPVLATAGTTQGTGSGFDTYEYVRGTSQTPPLEPSTKPAAGTDQGLEIVVGEQPADSSAASAATTPVAPAAKAQPRAAVPSKPAAGAVSAAKPTPGAKPAATAEKPAPKPAAAAKPAASTPIRVYWIQTASFKNRSAAEAMVGALGQKGLTGRVQVGDVLGQPYFRVRVGPYTSRGEAEKFLGWIRAVKGLEQSYISAVSKAGE
jgi:DedD protein